jgi:predicted amidohydrolase
MSAKLTVATCQFPVDADIGSNARYVLRQIRISKSRGADVAHFPEACLSGYAGTDFESYTNFDWDQLETATKRVLAVATELRMWVIVGSTHRLSGDHKPHNSLYVIDESGAIVDRYDKRFCGGLADERSGDLAHYTPGDHSSVFTIGGVRCGSLICHDYRYPELYRDYKRQGVQLIFHSFHAAHATPTRLASMRAEVGMDLQSLNPGATYPGITMPAAMTAAAADNHVWISCPNSSARESCWPSFFVRADGVTTGRLRRNVTGILITEIDTARELYDSTAAWRDRAIDGVLHSGTTVDDPRSTDRTQL